MRGRHRRCSKRATFGLTEYDAHPHQCTLAQQHTTDHDFSECPEGRKNEETA